MDAHVIDHLPDPQGETTAPTAEDVVGDRLNLLSREVSWRGILGAWIFMIGLLPALWLTLVCAYAEVMDPGRLFRLDGLGKFQVVFFILCAWTWVLVGVSFMWNDRRGQYLSNTERGQLLMMGFLALLAATAGLAYSATL